MVSIIHFLPNFKIFNIFKYLGTNLYQQLLDISGQPGQLFISNCLDHHNSMDRKKSDNGNESSASGSNGGALLHNGKRLTERIVKKLFKNMAEINFKPFEATLNCGSYFKLDSNVALWPQPLVRTVCQNYVYR